MESVGDKSASLGRDKLGDVSSGRLDPHIGGVAFNGGGRLEDAREQRREGEQDKVNADRRDAMLRCARP